MRAFVRDRLAWLLDLLLVPFVLPSAAVLRLVRRSGVSRLPICKNVLFGVGVFPIRNHYYEPAFDNRNLGASLSVDRALPGVNWNISGQIAMLDRFHFASELKSIPHHKTDSLNFYLGNGSFEAGDAEYFYQLIRTVRPRRLFEIGSGNSTLMAIKAIRRNQEDDPNYRCKHVCIEPYEQPWLERTGAQVLRSRVEDMNVSFFEELEENDILFIDSSHIIRPRGDVLFEYLQLLPLLNSGVIVHVHDIFSPRNYPKAWLVDDVLFWNEQYLLEAFLTHNEDWEVLGALNYLTHNHYDKLRAVAPNLTSEREPGSFYLRRTKRS